MLDFIAVVNLIFLGLLHKKEDEKVEETVS